MSMRRRMLLAQEQGLYRQVGYIQSSGTQWIDTGVTPVANGIRIDSEITIANMVGSAFYGYGYGSGNNVMMQTSIDTSGKNRVNYGFAYSNNISSSVFWSLSHKYFISHSCLKGNSYYKLDDSLLGSSIDSSNRVVWDKFVLFGLWVQSIYTVNILASIKLFSCKIYSDDGVTKLRNFIPVILTFNIPADKCADSSLPHTSGTAGLWDLVEDKFYANSGSGTFITP